MSSNRRYLLSGAAAVAIAGAIIMISIPTDAWVALDERRSATRVTPDGIAAFARSLEELGVRVSHRFTSFTNEPPSGAGLVLMDPYLPPSAEEVRILLEWVREGGTLLYAGFGPTRDSLMLEIDYIFHEPFEDPQRDTLLPHRWNGPERGGFGISEFAVRPTGDRKVDWEPLARSEEGEVLLAWLAEGQGGILALGDSEELTNRSILDSRIAVTAVRVLADRLGPNDTLYFSEYHQGLGGNRGLFREAYGVASSSAPGRAVMFLALTAILLALLAGRRFGTPLPDQPGPRRSTLEHVDALATIYETSDARSLVARYLVRGAARETRAGHFREDEQAIPDSWLERPELAGAANAAADALAGERPDLDELDHALDALVTRHHQKTSSS